MLRSTAVCSITGLDYSAMEIAPTMFGEWTDLFYGNHEIKSAPIAIQSCFFKTQHNLYKDSKGWIDHLGAVATFAESIGCTYLVIGSPAARLAPHDMVRVRPGDSEMAAADIELMFALREIADIHSGVYFGLEANPEAYGANVAVNANEALEIVKAAARPNIVFHIDTGCLRMAGDDPVDVLTSNSEYIRRGHISMKNLIPYDGCESLFISEATRLGIGLSYEARPHEQGEEGLRLFTADIENAMLNNVTNK